MSFDPGARLDPGQVGDVRGRTGGGRGPTLAVGGGGLGLIIAIAWILLGGDPSALIGTSGGGQVQGENQTLQQECQTGADANEREDCRIVGYVNSIQGYWGQALPQDANVSYAPARTWIFSDVIDTACGTATSQVGPFYCPLDRSVYLDLGFFETLSSRFGAQGGRFAEAYVVAHEYGHHIQNLIGVLEQAQSGETGPDSPAVKIELMADCLAGVWAKHAPAPVNQVTQQDIAQAIDAAQAVGDDRIQETTQGRVIPENFTHGTSEQRQQWFTRGFQGGTLNACNTFG
jgi:predicted metalloprotease